MIFKIIKSSNKIKDPFLQYVIKQSIISLYCNWSNVEKKKKKKVIKKN